MSKQPPPTASAVGPSPTVIQIVGRPSTGSLPSTIAPPNHPHSQGVRLQVLKTIYHLRTWPPYQVHLNKPLNPGATYEIWLQTVL